MGRQGRDAIWEKFLVGKPETKRLCGRTRCKFKGNFKVVFKGIDGCGMQPPGTRTVRS